MASPCRLTEVLKKSTGRRGRGRRTSARGDERTSSAQIAHTLLLASKVSNRTEDIQLVVITVRLELFHIMGKRPAASKATRGASKAKANRVQSSSSNPRTRKFRSQYNSLAVIAKGGPSKKIQDAKSSKKLSNGAVERREILDGLERANMIEHDGELEGQQRKNGRANKQKPARDGRSQTSEGTRVTTASFASVWSNCTNASLAEFFQVWNPNLEAHKDALAVIAGLSQMMSNSGTDQSDFEFAQKLYKILSSDETPREVLTGALLALTFVMRKLPDEIIEENFDHFYPVLKRLLETYGNCKRKSLIKCLLRCFACLTKAHTMGKEAIEGPIRKKINIAIRQYKVQSKISL